MTSKHTPGPWATRPGFGMGEIEVYPLFEGPPKVGMWSEIATVKDGYGEETIHGRYDFSDTEANARLIAASPDMLAALKALVVGREMTVSHHMWPEVAAALAAISKADGR